MDEDESPKTHVEFPMFGRKMLCGLLLKSLNEGDEYLWLTDEDKLKRVTCMTCRKEGRRRKLWQ